MTKQHKTNRHRSLNVKKSKRRGQPRKTRHITTKRGGALSRLSTISPRIYFIHNVLPLFTEFTTYMNPNPNPRPEDKSIVKFGERHYSSFADIPEDEALKASIRELQKDWSKEKTAEKAYGLYNKLLKTYEDAKKRQQQKENRPTPPTGQTFSHPLSASLASIVPASLRREPFRTPGFVESSNVDTPQKVSGDEKLPESRMTPSGMSFAPTLDNPYDTTARRLFDGDDYKTPVSSPMKSPPRVLSKSQSSNGQPLSLSRTHPRFA